jgi:hypothetical protein
MYFVFKTNYSFSSAMFDKQVQNLGSFFMHNTNRYENKICLFGKLMAVIAVILAFIRLYLISTNYDKSTLFYYTLIFDLTSLSLALIMNLNAAIYLIPLIVCEILILHKIYK